jgi:hypothetical protein
MTVGWEILAAATGKAIAFLRLTVGKDARILILIRNPNDGSQFVGSDIPHDEVPELLRVAANKHESEASYKVSKIVNKDGDEMKPKGDA